MLFRSLSVKSTTTFGHGAGTQFKVALTANNIPIEKRTVIIKRKKGRNFRSAMPVGICLYHGYNLGFADDFLYFFDIMKYIGKAYFHPCGPKR